MIDDIVHGRSTGARIPDEFFFEGQQIALKSVITHLLSRKDEGAISPVDRRKAEELCSQLRAKIRDLLQGLKGEDVTLSEGEHMSRECAGLNKALHVLEGIGKKRLSRKLKGARVDDARRWLDFGKKIGRGR